MFKVKYDYAEQLGKSNESCEDQNYDDGQCTQSVQWVKATGRLEKRSKSFQMGSRAMHKDVTATRRRQLFSDQKID